MPDRNTVRRHKSRLARLEKKGRVTSVGISRNESGTVINFSLSNRALAEIMSEVTTSIFSTSNAEIDQFNAKNNRSNALVIALPRLLASLFYFETDSGYASALAAASRAVKELVQVTQDYLADPVTAKLKDLRFPPYEVLGGEFQRQYERKLRLPGNSKLNFDLEAIISSYRLNLEMARETVVKNEQVYVDRLRGATSLEAVIAEAVKVAGEGSLKAAYLYLTRLARVLVPENIEHESRVAAFMSNTQRFAHLVRFKDRKIVKLLTFILRCSDQMNYTNSYITLGKLGLEDLLSALDHEERRTRYSSRAVYHFKTFMNFSDDPLDVAEFAASLQKIGASPGSAAEMLTAVPIGQRKHTFGLLYKKPAFVRLYERLKAAGIDARTFMPFVTELSDVEVQVTSHKVSLYDIINRLASQDRQRSGAAWLVRHPEVLDGEDAQQIIELAGLESPVPRLELYAQWRSDSVKGQVVLEFAKKLPLPGLIALSEALPNVQNEELEALLGSAAAHTLEQILGLRQPGSEQGQQEQAVKAGETGKLSLPPTAPSKAKVESNVMLWVRISYQHNPGIIEALMTAYENTPPHLQHRIRQVYSYVKEHHPAAGQESALMGYVSQLNQMSSGLRRYMLSNDRFFEAFLRHSPQEGFTQRLEQIVKESRNPYSDLAGIPELREKSRISLQGLQGILNPLRGPPNGAGLEGEVTEAEDSIAYTIVIIGNFGNKTRQAIGRKLALENVRPVFLIPEKRGKPYDCDGVLIFPGAGTPHSSEARNYYRSHGFPIRTIAGGYGINAVAEAAISFRNDLVTKGTNGSQRLSA